MFRRIAVPTVLVLVLALASTSSCAQASTKTSLLRGRTGQRHLVKLRTWERALQIVRFDIELRCHDGSVLIDEESDFMRTPLRRNDSFGEVQTGSTDTVMIRGRVRGKSVKGRLRVKDRLGKTRCDSHWVSFTARR